MSRLLALLALAGCAAPQGDQVLQATLDGAVAGCHLALRDPATKWDPGAREWCERLTRGCRD